MTHPDLPATNSAGPAQGAVDPHDHVTTGPDVAARVGRLEGNTPDGRVVALIDAAHVLLAHLGTLSLTFPAAQDALADLRGNPDVASVLGIDPGPATPDGARSGAPVRPDTQA